MSLLIHLEYNLLTSNMKAPGFTSGKETCCSEFVTKSQVSED